MAQSQTHSQASQQLGMGPTSPFGRLHVPLALRGELDGRWLRPPVRSLARSIGGPQQTLPSAFTNYSAFWSASFVRCRRPVV